MRSPVQPPLLLLSAILAVLVSSCFVRPSEALFFGLFRGGRGKGRPSSGKREKGRRRRGEKYGTVCTCTA